MKALKLIPPIKDYIWGGTRLRDEYGKISDLERLAESWELSCHKDGKSVIANGDFKGQTLEQYISENKDVLGKNAQRFEYFPILIKLIDARDNLSVQVHPDNEYALKHEGEYGKTEMWYIVDCDEGASLIYGFKNEISKEDFKQAIENNSLLEKVNTVSVKKGDVFFIQSGTLHAIGKGILIAEIQQNSNTTYRVYDYGRIGADGNPRELHIEKAVEVTSLTRAKENTLPQPVKSESKSRQFLAECEYFKVNKEDIFTETTLNADENSFKHILVIDGSAILECENEKMDISKGESIFIPSDTGEYKIYGKCSIIITEI